MSRMEEAIESLSEEELDLLNSDSEMLADFKAKYSKEEKPSVSDVVMKAGKKLLPSKETLEAPLKASEKLGTMVESGGSGIAELSKAILPRIGNVYLPESMEFNEPGMEESILQAGRNVEAVMGGLTPETPVGRAGQFMGSFFTPTQIALQATGAKAAPYVAQGLGAVAKPVAKFATGAFPRISKALGVGPEAVTRLVENPQAVQAAKSMPQMAEEVAGTVRGLSQKGMDVAKAGKALLSDTKVVTGLEKQLTSFADDIGGGPLAEESDQLAGKYVREIAEKLKDKLTEKEVGALIDSLDKKIGAKWAKANPTVITEAKEGVRRILSRALQDQNKNYAKAMAESAATFEPTEALTKSLGLREGAPSDTTISALRKVIDPEALGTQRALASFPGMAGPVADAAARAALQESLLGRSALFMTPKLAPMVSGAVRALPAVGNAIYQGLSR